MSRLRKCQAIGRCVEFVSTSFTYCLPTTVCEEALSMSGGLDSTTIISLECPGFGVQLSFHTDMHLLVNVWNGQ